MDPKQNLPLPVTVAASPTNSAPISPTDSVLSISSLPSLIYSTSSSSSAIQARHTSTLVTPTIPEGNLGNTSDMEGNRNQLARTMSQLAEAGFRPVWSREHGYSGLIPQDIAEYIDSNCYRFDELIGPLSSIFWLAGLDELVDAVYDPAIALQDEIRPIPTNVGVKWILEHLFEEGKVPRRMYDRYFFGYSQPLVAVMPVRLDSIPPQVEHQYACHRLEELFPACRTQCLPQDIATVRVKGDKNKERLSAKIHKHYISKLNGGSFFNSDNELGPGVYTTDSLEWALKFGSINSALLVFKNPDFSNLDVWRPPVSDWQHIVATWTRKSLSNISNPVPLRWKTADVIKGPISKPDSPKNSLLAPGDVNQIVAASYAGCEALSASLVMIIWLE
ncbi:hypothetical protein N7463_009575 [Penicillium fimorum]|uniref:Uncharacterized protein n=1 Tax=Penicillium fimorum TaxID=1882269 RepID=A0A9X0C4C4_9EURO|nr:hypothetical protein N7463_009575 [Penicillium fimorum]